MLHSVIEPCTMGRQDDSPGKRVYGAGVLRALVWAVPLLVAVGVAVAVTVRSLPGERVDARRENRRVPEMGALFKFPAESKSSPKPEPTPSLSLTAFDGDGAHASFFRREGHRPGAPSVYGASPRV